MEPEYTYGEDGIPVLIDDSSNPSSPVVSKPHPFKDVDSLTQGECASNPKLKGQKYNEDSKAVFTISGEGFDVILSEKNGRIMWSPMNGLGRRKKSGRKLSGFLRGRRGSVTEAAFDGVPLNSLFGAQMKRVKRPGEKGEGVCVGLILSLLEHKDENTLREKTIFMEHPSEELCSLWSSRIMSYIRDSHFRPTSIKLYLQPYAGNKTGRNLYQRTVQPIFQAAGINVELSEVAHNEFVKQEMIHMDMEDYDCIVCMGGDGTVSQVLDAFMNRAQKEKNVDMKHNASPVPCPIPLGIIPSGKTNNLAQSVMGVSDPVTAALHIVHGNFHPVDVCSIYTTEKFLKWGFNCQYGFAGQVLSFMKRYKALGSKSVDAAFVKALTKSKLRAYECDIEYIPADATHVKNKVCVTGCTECLHDNADQHGSETDVADLVQELDPLNQSFTSNASSVIDLPQDSPWRGLKGKYMSVGLFVNPGLCDIAPQGLSKYSHLNNGIIDMVLVKEAEKKEFVRHLRRFGNSKNQFDFPFIEIHKVKEVRFRPRFPMSWNYKDHDFNEIKYEMERVESQAAPHKSMEVIADLGSDDERSRPDSVCTLDISDDDDEEEKGSNKENGELQEQPRLVGPQYRKTFTEVEIARRREIARKKEEKQKAREESKMVSVWNIDNQIVTELELDFRVHNGLLRVCGLGVSSDTKYDAVRMGCLPGM